MKRIIFVCIVVIAFGTFNSFTSNQTSWYFIGDKWAAFGPDRDVLRVGGNNVYRQLKIKVTEGPVRIEDVDIYFENGKKANAQLKSTLKPGQESRVIELPGTARKLDRIEFLYSTVGLVKGKAKIAVWGRK